MFKFYNLVYLKLKVIRTLGGGGISGLTRMVSEDLLDQFVLTLLELVNDGVVERVLVLLKPSSDVVADLFYNNEFKA